MKNEKSPDGDGIMAEHLKFGGMVLLEFLQKLFNIIISNRKYQTNLNKPIWEPNSYRRITVASILGKTV